jgi:hypothetical protein
MGPVGSSRYVEVVCYDAQLDNGGGGKPYIQLSLRVVDGPNAGQNITRRCYLSEKAAPITAEQLRALGWTGSKLSTVMADGLGSTKARALLKVKQLDNGKLVEDVAGIYALGDRPAPATKSPAGADELASLDAVFSGFAAAAPVVAVTATNKAPEQLPAPVKTTKAGALPAKPETDEYRF